VPSNDNMTGPVTHAELREVLAHAFKTSEDTLKTAIIGELSQEIARAFKSFEESLKTAIIGELSQEIARAVKSSEESQRAHFSVMLDKAFAGDSAVEAKYSDLPPHVARLEAAVFPPKRPRRRRSA